MLLQNVRGKLVLTLKYAFHYVLITYSIRVHYEA